MGTRKITLVILTVVAISGCATTGGSPATGGTAAQTNEYKLVVNPPEYWAGSQLIHQRDLGSGAK